MTVTNYSMTVPASDADTEHLLPTAESVSPGNLTNLDQTSSPTTAFKLLPEGSTDYIELTTYSDATPNPISPHTQNNDLGLYDPGKTSYRIALGGLAFSMIFSIFCIGSGIAIALSPKSVTFVKPNNAILAELPSLCLNLLVTSCTESIGFVHSKSLQAALISEHRIQFNTNLRLITGTPGGSWTHPNGTLSNVIMATFLILSYVSSSLVFTPGKTIIVPALYPGPQAVHWTIVVLSTPIITLGLTLVLQTVIVCLGLRRATILTWSSSPFHTTAALLHHNQLIHKPGKCMHSVSHSDPFINPCTPSVFQPSAWQAHSSIKRIVIALWCLGLACAVWSGVVIRVGIEYDQFSDYSGHSGMARMGSWVLLPNLDTSLVVIEPLIPIWGLWLTAMVVMAGLQGPLTMGLHCCELLVNLLRDEAAWRKAVEKSGMAWSSNPLFAALISWRNVGLLVTKSVLRELLLPLAWYHSIDFSMRHVDWMFGLSLTFNVQGLFHTSDIIYPALIMRPVQVSMLACILMTDSG